MRIKFEVKIEAQRVEVIREDDHVASIDLFPVAVRGVVNRALRRDEDEQQILRDLALDTLGQFEVSEETGMMLELIGHLLQGVKRDDRRSLLAFRVERMNKEEIGYLLIHCDGTEYTFESNWGRAGIRTMLAGPSDSDREDVQRLVWRYGRNA